MLSFVLPTRDRPSDLARTLAGIGRLGLGPERAEVIVVDNASARTPVVPGRLACGAQVTLLTRPTNDGAAARNLGAEAARGEWVVMLDDDSHPLPPQGDAPDLPTLLEAQPREALAVMADIHLSGERGREQGGLPEVFIGCGVAIRRDAFLRAGGYDHAFGYYAEEYDLAAKLMLMGGRIAFEPAWRVVHHKVSAGRDMDLIVERLVRNNGWVAQRYAPDDELAAELERIVGRCQFIATKEDARRGFERGMAQLEATIGAQQRTPMDHGLWARFTGLAAARAAVDAELRRRPFTTASIVLAGKNLAVVERALTERGVEVLPGVPGRGEALVLGTLSPGPMLDGLSLLSVLGRRVLAPWICAHAGVGHAHGPRERAHAAAG